jgi:hypothetical protein
MIQIHEENVLCTRTMTTMTADLLLIEVLVVEEEWETLTTIMRTAIATIRTVLIQMTTKNAGRRENVEKVPTTTTMIDHGM